MSDEGHTTPTDEQTNVEDGKRTLTDQEKNSLPFDFKKAYAFEDDPTIYAVWHNKPVYSRNLLDWYFDAETQSYDDDVRISASYWEIYYPGYKHLGILDLHTLKGQFDEKAVRWSRTQSAWVYNNNHRVTFPQESTSDEEQQVDTLLEGVSRTVERLTEQVRQATPEQRTPETLPGEFPVTPLVHRQVGITALPTPIASGSTLAPRYIRSPTPNNPVPPPSTTSQAHLVPIVRAPTPRNEPPAPRPPPVPTTRGNPPLQLTTPRTTTTMASTTTSNPKAIGSAPEHYDGNSATAEGFWSSIENYLYLNDALYPDENKKIAAVLTYFKHGTPAGEWARDRQRTALALTPVNFGTWADFKAAFKAHFIPAETELEASSKMHSLHMGARPFNEWYQEWSNWATRAAVDEKTKMYAFRRNIPQALHAKILGVSPQPTTLEGLATKAREFDRLYRLYNNPKFGDQRPRQRNVRGATTEHDDAQTAQINLYTGDEPGPMLGKISKAEKDRRFKEKLCFYCGKPNHMAAQCRGKKSTRGTAGPGPRRDARTRALTQDANYDTKDQPSPSYEDSTHVSRFFHASDILRPKSAPVNEDF